MPQSSVSRRRLPNRQIGIAPRSRKWEPLRPNCELGQQTSEPTSSPEVGFSFFSAKRQKNQQGKPHRDSEPNGSFDFSNSVCGFTAEPRPISQPPKIPRAFQSGDLAPPRSPRGTEVCVLFGNAGRFTALRQSCGALQRAFNGEASRTLIALSSNTSGSRTFNPRMRVRIPSGRPLSNPARRVERLRPPASSRTWKWPVRIEVSSPASQAGDTGALPVRAAILRPKMKHSNQSPVTGE